MADAAADAEDDQHAEVPQRVRVGADARVLERPLANAGEDAVRADEKVEATRRAVVERHRHPGGAGTRVVAVVARIGNAVSFGIARTTTRAHDLQLPPVRHPRPPAHGARGEALE